MCGMQRYVSKMFQAIYVVAMMILFASLAGCSGEPTTIADIAYDQRLRSRSTDFRIFLEENGVYVPYLVLTANYGGNVLLLREHLLDERRPINPSPHGERRWAWQDFGAYYPDSNMDIFLNTEFKDTLGDSVIAAIVSSDITVTDKSSIGVTGRASYIITRYVFLLSLRELGVQDTTISVPEGERLRFFRGIHDVRVASLSDGQENPYWTRTPNTWGSSNVFTIGVNTIGSGTADVYSGVRPAFCLDRSTPIKTRTDIIIGETVFVLDTNNQ